MKNIQLVALLAAAAASQVKAGGIYLYETAGPEVGLANAGSAARAQDATTILGNPAGMTHLAGDQLTTGVQVLAGNSSYHLDNDAQISGASPGNVLEPFPSASFFWSHSVDDRLKLGVGMYGNFGLALHYGDWAASGLVTDATLTALNIQPTAAYRLNDQWSVGAGVGISYGYFSLKHDSVEGEQKSKDHDWALNAHLGVLYDADPATRFGLTYTSKTDYHFAIDDKIVFTHTFPATGATITDTFSLPLAALVNTPQQVMFSAYHDINRQFAIMGNLGWQDWSAYSDSTVEIGSIQTQSGSRLQDTGHVAVGLQYRPDEKWRIDGGIAWDSSMYKNQGDGSLTMPAGAAWRFGTGAQYKLDAQSAVGATFEYLRMQGNGVQNPTIKGAFDTGDLFFVALNYSRAF
ncbi:OmpP1/FadL family transporter [Silvimonas amylolytica]|uniref:Fatty acid transporter n=1 Tax=Silvimonas amylolytica TaxID=449663 RepID=A0ABQ2PN99_9NEIS|nr:outer membrane protein transport protein [Silvimonas amylolytica]GGP27080.1 fatty acid transporter [Silvimonas amylolytica]